MSEKSCINPRMNRVGGQAVLEGVMMKSGENVALSVRKEDGTIDTETKKFVSVRKKYKILNIPVVRGVVNMVETFRLSYSILGRNAEILGIDDFEAESKFEKWLRDKFGDKLMGVIMSIAMVFGVALAMFLFSYLPLIMVENLNKVVELGWFRNLIQGLIKIAIFVGYILLISLMPDMKRTFEYHGAEHKSIACYEAGVDLTPENAAKYTRLHPRCGTSFIFVVLIISILVFSLLPWSNRWLRLALQFACLPPVIGLSFEFIMYAGKHDNILTKILSAPGLAMQKITTREPSLDQLEVALTSLKAAMPDEFPPEPAAADEPQSEPEAASEGGGAETTESGVSEGTESDEAENTEGGVSEGTESNEAESTEGGVSEGTGSGGTEAASESTDGAQGE